jgi:hypothetical protein
MSLSKDEDTFSGFFSILLTASADLPHRALNGEDLACLPAINRSTT